MKTITLIIAIFAIANGEIDPDFRSINYIPIMPLLPSHGDTQQEVSPYIVGGREAKPHSIPYQAALNIDNKYFCGGFLISRDWVVSAAHCTFGARKIIVQLGAHDRTANELTQVVLESTKIITHEDYNERLITNDIGLVKLPYSVQYTNAIQSIALPSPRDPDLGAGVDVTISGWGLTSDGAMSHLSQTLNVVTVPTITNQKCANFYSDLSVPDSKFCTSGAGGHGPCNGDSGGPVTYESPTGKQVRGIVSFGSTSGCTLGYPVAYTRVTHYLDWIRVKTGVTY